MPGISNRTNPGGIMSLFRIHRIVSWRIFLVLTLVAASVVIHICFKDIVSGTILDTPADLTIVHLTDLHLSSRTNTYDDVHWTHKVSIGGYKLHKTRLGKSISLFEQAIRLINTRIRPDIVVITGDTVNSGSDEAAFRKARELVQRIECPVIVTDGDHDPAGGKGSLFGKHFGSGEGSLTLKGCNFFFMPYESDEAALQRLGRRISDSNSGKYSVLCMHRMLRASFIMKKLSKKYTSTILSPNRERILDIMEKNRSEKFVVLCGHSHTNYQKKDGNIFHICTSSLAEYPHEFRVVKFIDGKIKTGVYRLSMLQPD